jgi:SAM-dependent methyltransferase
MGYDAASSIIEENQLEYADLPNIAFDQAVLPSFDVYQQFDFVFSYATLHYVRESERAIENLHDHVRTGGRLVFITQI